jgi:hypothetical protein
MGKRTRARKRRDDDRRSQLLALPPTQLSNDALEQLGIDRVRWRRFRRLGMPVNELDTLTRFLDLGLLADGGESIDSDFNPRVVVARDDDVALAIIASCFSGEVAAVHAGQWRELSAYAATIAGGAPFRLFEMVHKEPPASDRELLGELAAEEEAEKNNAPDAQLKRLGTGERKQLTEQLPGLFDSLAAQPLPSWDADAAALHGLDSTTIAALRRRAKGRTIEWAFEALVDARLLRDGDDEGPWDEEGIYWWVALAPLSPAEGRALLTDVFRPSVAEVLGDLWLHIYIYAALIDTTAIIDLSQAFTTMAVLSDKARTDLAALRFDPDEEIRNAQELAAA